jgi:antitoxin (DNA-binding transcriptional repressor) of toxin-antitoxin stability system
MLLKQVDFSAIGSAFSDGYKLPVLSNLWVDMTIFLTYNKTMIILNINEIKTHFSKFLTKVSNGETVVVCKRNVPIAQIKPIAARPAEKRPIGLAGKEYPDFKISNSFFEPLPDDIVSAFNGKEP